MPLTLDQIDALFRQPLSKAARGIQADDDSQDQSIIDAAAGATLGGLQWVGESLDKAFGGRTNRAAFGPGQTAEWSDLAHLIPFSDTLGFTDNGLFGNRLLADKSTVPGGEEINQQLGMHTGNPWIDIPGAILTEMAYDPIGTALVGPGRAIKGGAGAAAKAGKLMGLTPQAMAREISAGERAMFGLKVPFMDAPFATLGSGPMAGAAYQKMAESAPVRALRQLFDKRAGGVMDKAGQKFHDDAYELTQKLSGQFIDAGLRLKSQMKDLTEMWDGHLKNAVNNNPAVKQALAGGMEVGNMQADEFSRALAEYKHKHGMSKLADLMSDYANQKDISKAITAFDDYADEWIKLIDNEADAYRALGGGLGELAGEYEGYFPRRLAAHMRQLMPKNKADSQAMGMWANIRRSVRDIPGRTYVANLMSKDPLIVNALDELDPSLLQMMPEMRKQRIEEVANYMNQQYNVPRELPLMDADGAVIDAASLYLPDNVPSQIGALTESLTKLGFTGNEINNLDVQLAYDFIKAIKQRGTIDPAANLAEIYTRLPKQVLEEGLYSRGTVIDGTDYLVSVSRNRAGLESMHKYLAGVPINHDPSAEGVSVAQLFRDLKIHKPGWDHFKKAAGLPEDANLTMAKIPHQAAEIAKSYVKWNSSKKETTGILKAYDKFLNLFRGSNYGPFLASHNRNMLSDLSTNLLTAFSGASGPVNAMKALNELRKVVSGKESAYLDGALMHGLARSSLLAELGGLSGKLAADLPDSAPTIADLAKPFDNLRNTTINPFKKNFWDRSSGEHFWGSQNPIFPLNFRGAREGLENKSTFILADMGERVGSLAEFAGKYMHFVGRKLQGWSDAAAARSAKAALFTADNTEFEQSVMRRLIPYYNFARKNLVAQIRHIVDQPGGPHGQFIRGTRVAQERGKERGEYVPKHLRGGIAVPLGKKVKGDEEFTTFFTSKSLTPVEEAFNRFVFTAGVPDLPRTLMNVLAMTTPAIQIPGQIVSGKQFWSGRDLKDLHQTPFDDAPTINMLASSLPFSRFASTARGLTDDRKTPGEKALNFGLGGMRITDVDTNKWKSIDAQKALEEELEPLGGVRKYSRLYVSDPDSLTPEELQRAAVLDEIVKRSEKKSKSRKKEREARENPREAAMRGL